MMQSTRAPVPASRRTLAGLVSAATVLAGGAGAWALAEGGALRRSTQDLGDGGLAVAIGLPGVRLAAELAAVVVIGALLGALVFSPRGDNGALSAAAGRFARLSAVAGLSWAIASVAQMVFVCADLTGQRLGSASMDMLVNTALYVPQGRALLIAATAGLLIFGCAWLAAGPGPLVAALTAGVAGVVPAAFAGHAASSLDHQTATISLSAHILAAVLWAGGLGAVLLAGRWDRTVLPVAAHRFSRIAVVCFTVVAASGLINAWLRVGSLDRLTGTGYGVLLQVKLFALVALAGFGWWHRQRTLPALARGDGRDFARFAVAEVLVMAATVGVAVGLGRAQAPGRLDITGLTPADALLGYRMPPAPTAASLFTDWRPDLFFTVAVLVAGGCYLLGVARLRRDGVAWPVQRTLCWLAGLLIVLVAISSGLARYAPLLFSVHMIAHMLTAMLAPVLLVLGAPVTLALRALPAGGDPRFPGPRAWLTAALHSRLARVLTHPATAAILWVGGLYVMYFSGAYEYALRNHPAHLAMYTHFILSGYLFFAVLIGPDPMPHRLGHPARFVLLLGALVFHAFFGVALMNTSTVIAADWFTDLARPWGPDPLADQRTGGGIAWAIGEAPAVLVAFILFRQWVRDDEREQRRLDRAADRDGDAALEAYNDWLRQKAGR
jgi:cytochrome c oxidase assembly factor CtaG